MENNIHPCGGVAHEHDVFRISSEKRGEIRSRRIQHRFQISHEKLHRLALHPLPNGALEFQDHARAAPKRSVIEEINSGIQQPQAWIAHGIPARKVGLWHGGSG